MNHPTAALGHDQKLWCLVGLGGLKDKFPYRSSPHLFAAVFKLLELSQLSARFCDGVLPLRSHGNTSTTLDAVILKGGPEKIHPGSLYV